MTPRQIKARIAELQGELTRLRRRIAPATRAEAFLLKLLADGPVTTGQGYSAAYAEGVSDYSLQAARKRLGVRTYHGLKSDGTLAFWCLPHHDTGGMGRPFGSVPTGRPPTEPRY